ncbi:MAG: hypothetical protein U1A78_07150 [Polyangia bacterium]
MKTLTRLSLWAGAGLVLIATAAATGSGCDSGGSSNTADMMTTGSGDMTTTGAADMAMVGVAPFAKLSAGFRQPFGTVWDPTTSAWYVANVDGTPSDPKSLKDGKGAITKIPVTGGMPGQPDHAWLNTGLNAPTGIKLYNNKLYFADVDQLVVVDIATKSVVRSATVAPSAQASLLMLPTFMLDVTVDPATGAAYAIDATGGRIVKFMTPLTANNTGAIVGNQGDYSGPSSIYYDMAAARLVITEAGINQFIMVPGGVSTVKLDGTGKMQLVTTTQNELAFAGCEKDNADYLIGSPKDKLIYRVNATSGSKVAIQSIGDGAFGLNDFGIDPATRTIAVPDASSNLVLFYKLQ